MTFLLLYPAVAAVAMLIVFVIMIMLRYGPRLCGLRHHALSGDQDRDEDWSDEAYDQQISYA